MWFQKNFFKYATAILLTLTIVLVAYNIAFLLSPVQEFFTIIFLPILVSGIFYYLFRPFVRLMEKYRIGRLPAILILYVIVICLLALISVYIVPFVIEQVNILTEPPKIEAVKETTSSLLRTPYLEDFVRTYLYKINDWISSNLVITITTITRFAVLIFITPFILFYFLKDDESFYAFVIKNVPVKYEDATKMILSDIDTIMSKFITGQALLAMIMGCLLFIGYTIIGLHHAAILALFAALFFTIPILGSILSLIPALLVGLTVSGFMALKVLIVMLVALWLEGQVISPQMMSQRLNIHPVVLILLLLASGALYGILGLFLATPIFAIVRVIISDIAKIRDEEAVKKVS